MADGRQNRKTAISPQWFKRFTWAAAVSRGIPRICRGDPGNLANGAAEFGKICRGKLWALVKTHASYVFCCCLAVKQPHAEKQVAVLQCGKFSAAYLHKHKFCVPSED